MKSALVVTVIVFAMGGVSVPLVHGATNQIFDSRLRIDRVPTFNLPAGMNKRLKVYSIGANHVISTNVVDFNAAGASLHLDKNLLHIVPTVSAASSHPEMLRQTKTYLDCKIVIPKVVNGKQVLELGRVFLSAVQSPLRWNNQKNAYATTLDVGVDFDRTARVTKLPAPMVLELLTQNASVSQQTVRILKPGTPYKQVTLLCQNGNKKAVVTAHFPGVQDKVLEIPCEIELGSLRIESASTRIYGYGLGSAKLTVKELAKDHFDYSSSAESKISLESTLGRLDCGSSVTIPAGQAEADVELRSAGIGIAEITAEYGPYSAKENIKFIFPWGILIATLIGSGVGGLVRVTSRKEKGKPYKWIWMLIGLGTALIVVAASMIGVVILDVPTNVIGSEGYAFVIAGLCGYFGTAMFKKIIPGSK